MTRSKEKWQAHMNRVGGSMLRNETAELSQYFSQFGSDFETVDPECYAPGGAPGCDFGGMDKKDFYQAGYQAYKRNLPNETRKGKALGGWQGKAWRNGWMDALEFGPVNLDEEDLHQKTVKTYSIKGKKVRVVLNWRGNTPSGDPDRFYDVVDASGQTLNLGEPWHDNDEGPPTRSEVEWLVKHGGTEFGLTKIPAGMKLPPSWGVPDASMVKRGETPEGWDPNLFSQFGELGWWDK